jgi:hypothetical protein
MVLAGGLVLAAVGGPSRADVVGDDCNDDLTGPAWSVVTDDPVHLALAEQNQRLEMLSSGGGADSDDALYLSNGPGGFRVSTAQDFHLTVDYSFGAYRSAGAAGDALALDFGVGRDLDGTDSAAVGFGYTAVAFGGGTVAVPGGLVAHRVDDVQGTDAASLTAPASGTFDLAYDSTADDLTLSIVGGSLSYTLDGTVRGTWGADSLLVSFGGRGSGFATASGDAYLDNFRLLSGQTVPVPEPAMGSLGALGAAALVMLRRRSSMRAGRRG